MSQIIPQVQSAIDSLKFAHLEVSNSLTEVEFATLRARVLMNLEKEINFLSYQFDINPTSQVKSNTIGDKPITSFLGRSLGDQTKAKPFQQKLSPVDQALKEKLDEANKDQKPDPLSKQGGYTGIFKTGDELAAEELRIKRDELYKDFLTIDSPDIVDAYSDIEIRAVAKYVGLPVTETNPKNADVKFVDQIKDAIKKKNELDAIGNGATNPNTAIDTTLPVNTQAENASDVDKPADGIGKPEITKPVNDPPAGTVSTAETAQNQKPGETAKPKKNQAGNENGSASEVKP